MNYTPSDTHLRKLELFHNLGVGTLIKGNTVMNGAELEDGGASYTVDVGTFDSRWYLNKSFSAPPSIVPVSVAVPKKEVQRSELLIFNSGEAYLLYKLWKSYRTDYGKELFFKCNNCNILVPVNTSKSVLGYCDLCYKFMEE